LEIVSFSDIVRRTWQGNQLFSALVELTYRCNLDCYFCYNDLGLRGKPLSKEQYFELFDGLRRLGTLNLILSGGEPLAHPEFFDLGARARELGFVVRVKSNGHALHGDVARRVREEVDPFVVEMSLHGATAATHDRQTRVPGSFDRLIANIVEAKDLGLRLKLNSTLTAWNEHELEDIIALTESLGVSLQIDPEVSPRDDGDSQPLSIRASREAVSRLFRIQAARRARERSAAATVIVEREGDDFLPPGDAGSETTKHCGAGSATVAVDPFGAVFPCVQWRHGVGNLHDRSIEEIWGRSSDLDDIRRANESVKEMIDAEGRLGAMMSFCPGTAAAQTGSPVGIYPAVAARKGLREQAEPQAARSLLPIID
jgi:radical SAM protein with 4Fe4S-binding SPASM domain